MGGVNIFKLFFGDVIDIVNIILWFWVWEMFEALHIVAFKEPIKAYDSQRPYTHFVKRKCFGKFMLPNLSNSNLQEEEKRLFSSNTFLDRHEI